MTPILVEVSTVVAANAHNPSILNHDWLVTNNVLPGAAADWELAEPPFSTQPLSNIHYQNNVHLVLDSGRLAVTAQNTGNNHVANPGHLVMKIARRYVEILEHVPYVGVGNNFKVMIEWEKAQRKLIEVFSGTGTWTDNLEALSAKLTYRLTGDYQRNVEISAATVQKFEENVSKPIDAVVLSANYHRNTPTKDLALKAIAEASSDLTDFLEFSIAFGKETSA